MSVADGKDTGRSVSWPERQVRRVDRFQQRHALIAFPWAVLQKFGDDQANQYVVGLGWYGFTAIYPLLLVVVTVFAFIGAASLGTGIVSTNPTPFPNTNVFPKSAKVIPATENETRGCVSSDRT